MKDWKAHGGKTSLLSARVFGTGGVFIIYYYVYVFVSAVGQERKALRPGGLCES